MGDKLESENAGERLKRSASNQKAYLPAQAANCPLLFPAMGTCMGEPHCALFEISQHRAVICSSITAMLERHLTTAW